MALTNTPERPLTGWHVLAMFVAFFGVIIAVNVTLAWQAIATFPGLEVGNGYIASQTFDAERSAQQALNWHLAHSYDAQTHQLRLAFTDAQGMPVTLGHLEVLVGRPTETSDDMRPVFVQQSGVYVAVADLHPGKWMMAVIGVAADDTLFRQRLDLFVEPANDLH